MAVMRAVVQRVSEASVTVAGERVGAISGPGLCVLVGVTHGDTAEKAAQLARKLWTLRLFDGGDTEQGASERSCSDIDAPLLVISQFTLYGDARKGRRPTWNAAAPDRSPSRWSTRWCGSCARSAPRWRPAASGRT